MAFWRQLDPAQPAVMEHPPLADEAVAFCEHKFGLKFPPALIALLKTKNGGVLENRDFRIGTINFSIGSIHGIGNGESIYDIRPVSSLVDPSDPFGTELWQKLEQHTGDLSKLLIFADGDIWWYALDYNHLNSQREPKVIAAFTNEDEASSQPLADSIEQVLNSQYFGDPEPIVKLEEAASLQPIAEGGYVGTCKGTGLPVKISWKILSRGSQFITLSSEDWGLGEGVELIRGELAKSDLCFGGELPDNFESELAELGPEVISGIRSQVMAPPIELYDVNVKPRCYVLRLAVQPGEAWVKCQSSKSYHGRWKNRQYEVVYTSVYSADKHTLERTLMALTNYIAQSG
jgi:hypothetical protein